MRGDEKVLGQAYFCLENNMLGINIVARPSVWHTSESYKND